MSKEVKKSEAREKITKSKAKEISKKTSKKVEKTESDNDKTLQENSNQSTVNNIKEVQVNSNNDESINKTKEELTGKPSRFVTLTGTDKTNLKNLKKLYKNDSNVFTHAFKAMLNNEWVKEKGMANPTHFLRNENFQRYANTDIKLIKNNESRDDKLLAYVKRNLKK